VPWPYSRLFLILALLFFVLDALLLGGVISGSDLGWLLPAGAASTVLALLVP
jgi:hypothetical protein